MVQIQSSFMIFLNSATSGLELWSVLKLNKLEVTKKVCGWTKNHPPRKQTWWWNIEDSKNHPQQKIEKKTLEGEEVLWLERTLPCTLVYAVKKKTKEHKFKRIKDYMDNIFRIVKQMRRQILDVIDKKCIRDDQGIMALDEEAKEIA